MMKLKSKADRAAARAAAANSAASLPSGQSAASSRAHTPTGGPSTPGDDEISINTDSAPSVPDLPPVLPLPGSSAPDVTADRASLLLQHEQVVNQFISPMVPILVDVYAASVSGPVRLKALTSLLKAICFQDEEQLKHTFMVGRNVNSSTNYADIYSECPHCELYKFDSVGQGQSEPYDWRFANGRVAS